MASIADAFDFLRGRKRAYQLTFEDHQPANQIVLEDLARFCRATESCVIPGDRDRTLVLEGRREVWLRITQHLHLQPEVLLQLFASGASIEGKRQ